MHEQSIKLVSTSGKGRAFIVLHESGNYEAEAQSICTVLQEKALVLHLESERIDDVNWEDLSGKLLEVALQNEVKVFSLLTLGATSVLAQVVALRSPRTIRTLVLVDPTVRAHPSKSMRFMDWLESYLPLGLPFRSNAPGFDGRSLLQRIRCPTLVAVTPLASEFIQEQAAEIGDIMPTAWHIDLNKDRSSEMLCECALQFLDVPARFPQKNIRAAKAAAIER